MHFSLRKITASNFRSIRKPVCLDFTSTVPGLYFIRGWNETGDLGSNGAGKSTLFVDTLYWALTGRVTRSQRPGSDVENWYEAKAAVDVAVEFSLDSVIHEVRRTRNPNNLTLDGQKVEQDRIDTLLPLTDAALRRSIIIDQFGDMFLSLRPEDKSRIFSETLGLDTWIKASDKAGDEATKVERRLQENEKKLAGIEAASVEANTQLDVAEEAEARFETEIKGKIKEAAETAATAHEEAGNALTALDRARDNFAAYGSDERIQANNIQTEIRRLNANLNQTVSAKNVALSNMSIIKKQLESYQGKLKICPECGQEVSDKHIADRRKELFEDQNKASLLAKECAATVIALTINLEKMETELAAKEKRLVKYNEMQTVVAVAAEKSINSNREANRAKAELEKLKEMKNPYSSQCDDLSARLVEMHRQKKELVASIEGWNHHLEIYKFWQRGYRDIRLEQIDATLAELELATNAHAESLGLKGWEIGFATEREKKTGGVAHAFSVFLYPPGQKEPISWESYSGGESQRWQLGTTFGLAEVLLARSGISTDFEVLDEPTTHLSPEGIDDLLACLADRAHDLNRRIFVIDHHALDRGAFDGVITVLKDGKGSRIADGDGVLQLAEPKKTRVRI